MGAIEFPGRTMRGGTHGNAASEFLYVGEKGKKSCRASEISQGGQIDIRGYTGLKME